MSATWGKICNELTGTLVDTSLDMLDFRAHTSSHEPLDLNPLLAFSQQDRLRLDRCGIQVQEAAIALLPSTVEDKRDEDIVR